MSAPRGIFVTGTDTGVGKTVVAVALLRALVASGRRAVGMKPVSAGIEPDESVNADVVALDEAGNVDAPVADRNPFAFAPAIAPHLAAAQAGVAVDLAVVAAAYARLASRCDVVVVEGAGGVLVPIDATQDMLDIAAILHLPVVLVVGMRLGCLNHALLSAAAIRARRPAVRRMGCQLHRSADARRGSQRGNSVRAPAGAPDRDHPLGRVAGPFADRHPRTGAVTFHEWACGRPREFRANILGFGSNWRKKPEIRSRLGNAWFVISGGTGR